MENPDLFWAIRGGGGNFGVVSSFEYCLHPVGPQVLTNEFTYTPAQTRRVLEYYSEFGPRAPRELDLGLSVQPDEHGSRYAQLGCTFVGSVGAGRKALGSIRAATKPHAENERVLDYVELQRQYDGPVLSEYTEYMKNGFVDKITPALINAIIAEKGSVSFGLVGGAISDVAPTASALAHRSEPFVLAVSASWKDPAENEHQRAEIHAVWDRLRPFTSGFYSNLSDADQKALDDNFGPNRDRLMQIKKQYDPGNLFRLNANIQPA